MRGYLIYHNEEAVRNQAFIELFQKEGRQVGITFDYISYEKYQKEPLPDFVLNRTRDASVSKWYEQRNVKVFHSALITEIGNHKLKTLEYLEKKLPKSILQTKWAPKSVFVSKDKICSLMHMLVQEKSEIFDDIFFEPLSQREYVLKSVDGHGGTEVAALKDCNNRDNLLQFLQRFEGKDCILQEKILSDSKDVRVYILGNQIYQAVCRQGIKDFRSNFSLGGRAFAYELSMAERNWIQKFIQAFGQETLGLVGIDFIISTDGELVFNELEEMVGCRMLYQHTDCNVVKDYVAWIKKFVENYGCQ